MTRLTLASVASVALLVGGTAAPATAQEVSSTSSHSSNWAPEDYLFGAILFPTLFSSMFSSYILGIPQCGLHDTSAC
ncbi:MAG: hypothetical protein Q4G50_10835 [Corynebacterium sp.]|uniref:hypothetical protein n=1 Tax=Corynebacterium sp. TaxID=1720 RepID=UPI0026DFFBBF|nr:hypothetical protein [Corynebacterium sp.]MDO5670490.1 hypothetical protein [Corynebacterium sp.]